MEEVQSWWHALPVYGKVIVVWLALAVVWSAYMFRMAHKAPSLPWHD